MLTKDEKIHSSARAIILIILLTFFIALFVPFLTPLLMACYVALGCEPLMKRINFKTKKRKFFSFGLFLVLLVVFLVPLVIFIFRIANGLKSLSAESMQKSQFFQALFSLWEHLQSYGTNLIQTIGLEQNIIPQKDELIGKVSPYIMDKATLFLASLPDLLLSLFVFCCILFILIVNASEIKRIAQRTNFLPSADLNLILETFQNSCYTTLISTFLIGALQATIVATGSLIFGFQEFFLIFAITFFVSFIPLLGAGPVAVLLALISFILGNTGDGIGLTVVAAIAGTIDNIIKPYIFSKDEGSLNPIISLLGIIGAIVVFGLPGLLLGPLLLQVTVKLAPALTQKLAETFSITQNTDA
ncbi:MAG: AI-2E family transporter [Pseudobdellovibrio sp.]